MTFSLLLIAGWGHLRGGLASATIAACAGFAALSGSSLASAVTMGRVALPEMKRYKYADSPRHGVRGCGRYFGISDPPVRRHDHLCGTDRTIHRAAFHGGCLSGHHPDVAVHRCHLLGCNGAIPRAGPRGRAVWSRRKSCFALARSANPRSCARDHWRHVYRLFSHRLRLRRSAPSLPSSSLPGDDL